MVETETVNWLCSLTKEAGPRLDDSRFDHWPCDDSTYLAELAAAWYNTQTATPRTSCIRLAVSGSLKRRAIRAVDIHNAFETPGGHD